MSAEYATMPGYTQEELEYNVAERIDAVAESQTNAGCVDAMVTAGEWIYVVEFKLNKSAKAAMTQIQNKEYAVKFHSRGKRIMLIGVNFDFASGQITDWISEEVAQ